jgi:pimeloyl-ACP methyl ester carboxylesterase
VLKAAGATAGIGMSGIAQRVQSRAFVLVHPAWHGAWCWKKVTPLLRKRGHDVYAPTLSGLGERSHLARADVGLDIHVSDIVNVLHYEDLRDVILVGHSSGGAVITGVTDRAPQHIAHVIYVDAFVPEHNQSVFDLVAPERRRIMETLVETEGSGWLLARFAPPTWETIVRDMWGVNDEGDVRWLLERLGPTPVRHFRDSVHRANPAAMRVPCTYIRCRRFQSARFDEHAEMARKTAGWRYRELGTSHHPAVTAPEELTELLLEVA